MKENTCADVIFAEKYSMKFHLPVGTVGKYFVQIIICLKTIIAVIIIRILVHHIPKAKVILISPDLNPSKGILKKLGNLALGLIYAIIIIVVAGIFVFFYIYPIYSQFMDTHNVVSDTIKPALNLPTETSIEKSKENLDYINSIRATNGKSQLTFDARVYELAKARANDLDRYNYFDHTNPVTGSCAWSIKSQYGFTSTEFVAENIYGSQISVNGGTTQHQAYTPQIENNAVDSWLTSRGHRYNLLYTNHISGAIYCSPNSNCVFLGLNHDGFGDGCSTGAEGLSFWNHVGTQSGEV
jgi:uncharacterized protein YkwD